MSKLWSEENHVVNAIIPVADAWDSNPVVSDVINVADYKRVTFLIVTGATSAVLPQVTVLAGLSKDSCTTAIIFKYRTQIGAVPPAALSDVASALIAAGVDGFAMTASKAGGLYIIEVDVREVAEAGAQFDHVALNIDENADTAQTGCVLAILSQPRYGTLKTAIG